MADERLALPALSRALLARQGLLERRKDPVVDVVESIGAIQAQYWPAPPVALWSRVRDFDAADLYRALEDGLLVTGTLLRATLHVTSAREHPEYAAVTALTGATAWHRTKTEPGPEAAELRSALLEFTASEPRTADATSEFIEDWLAAHAGALDAAEQEAQRSRKWRPFRTTSDFLRVPADGRWGARTPAAFRTAPTPPSAPDAPDPEQALATVVRRHLRAFGPAAAEDVASWIGARVPPVRKVLGRLEPDLARFGDEADRTLFDLPEAPRPDPEVPVPARFLPSFDSTLLAYTPKHRARILPDEYRDAVYMRGNLRILPTFLVDGLVAGTWKVETSKREATLTVQPFGRLSRTARKTVLDEGEQLIRFAEPAAKSHQVTVAG